MNSQWKKFLSNAGAQFSEIGITSFGDLPKERLAADSTSVICDLSHYRLISAVGEGTINFLQGQFTNDISKVDLEHSQLDGYCTPKGRMLSNFRLFKRRDTLYISLPNELFETTLARLRMYIMRSKVTLDDASESLIRIGLSGAKASEQLHAIIDTLPDVIDQTTQHEDFTVIKVAGAEPRYEIYGEVDAMTKLWLALSTDATPVGADIWELLNIRAGLPVITAGTSEAFVPQMVNMELINGVDFKKGCYTGQEIVARMHYLGKLKKRMYHIGIKTDQQPQPGDSLFTQESKGGSGTGTIVSAQQQADGSYEALAVIQITDAENQPLRLHDANGPEVKILKLPYSLNEKK